MLKIIVPTCGGEHFAKTLDSMMRYACDAEVWVVLNEEEGEKSPAIDQALEACYHWAVNLIHIPERIGFVKACNLGFRAADVQPEEYLVIANDDLVFEGPWWEPMKEALDKGALLVGPSVKPVGHDAMWGNGSEHYHYVEGWLLAVKGHHVPMHNLFDPLFVDGFCEDMDLAITLRERWGGSIQQVNVPVRHLRSQTYGTNRPSWEPNRKLLIEKWNLITGGPR